jgi:hypothetical protein
VIILSLAVFDRVKAEGLAASAEPDARNAPDLAARPRLRVTRSEIAIHEFGRHRHHDQSKNPAHHTTGSKLAPRRAVLTSTSTPSTARQCKRWRIAGRYQSMFAFFSNRLGCLGSIVVSVIGMFCSPSCAAATESHVTIVASSLRAPKEYFRTDL